MSDRHRPRGRAPDAAGRRARPGMALGTAMAFAAALGAGEGRAQMAPPVVTTVQIFHWASEPTFAEVEAAKPAGVTGRGIVTFRGCSVGEDGRLKTCRVKAEPDDERLRKAAEALLPRYRFGEADAKAITAHSGSVDFYIGWRADGACGPPFCRPAGSAPSQPPK